MLWLVIEWQTRKSITLTRWTRTAPLRKRSHPELQENWHWCVRFWSSLSEWIQTDPSSLHNSELTICLPRKEKATYSCKTEYFVDWIAERHLTKNELSITMPRLIYLHENGVRWNELHVKFLKSFSKHAVNDCITLIFFFIQTWHLEK